jgi:hypothetical protein
MAGKHGSQKRGKCIELIYASSNGDQWFLARHVESAQVLVRHVPSPASGGEPIHMEIDAFLSKDRGSPQGQELLRMIGSLIPEEISHADRVEVTRNGQTNQFSIVLCVGTDTIRCMVSVASGPTPDLHSDEEKQRAALSKAKALAKALDAAIEEE